MGHFGSFITTVNDTSTLPPLPPTHIFLETRPQELSKTYLGQPSRAAHHICEAVADRSADVPEGTLQSLWPVITIAASRRTVQSVRSIQSTTATTATQLDGMQRTVIVAEGLGTTVQLDRWHSLRPRRPSGARGQAQSIGLSEPTTSEARPASAIRG